jgi:catechol 2,3-dioxygenase-like lactoylglutathione lyase family enzyme
MINGINHITLSVKDIDESFKFYKEILGLKPIMKSKISAYFTAENTWIALTKDECKTNKSDYSHIAFNIDSKKFNTLKNRIKDYGAKEWQENKTEGYSFYFLDPSGNKLEIHSTSLEDRIKYGRQHWGKDVEWFV